MSLVQFFLVFSSMAHALENEMWEGWIGEWHRWEAIARSQDWQVTPTKIRPPASKDNLRRLSKAAGVPIPVELRELMLERSKGVVFGWSIPGHLQAMERQSMPFGSASRDVLWDIDHIQSTAIPNFLGWKKSLQSQTESEALNTPKMWENQFPLSELMNGDMITIDVSHPTRQPLRYFSHELQGWHGTEIAPDLETYITERSRTGWAGTEQDSMALLVHDPRAAQLKFDASTPGALAWIAWAERDPDGVLPNEPPRTIVVETSAEKALLLAAIQGDRNALRAALASGARPDVTANQDMRLNEDQWGWEYDTALNMAIERNDLAMAQDLLDAGATLDTRRLPLAIAADASSIETVNWLIEKGARVNGWRYDRHAPLHILVTRRGANAHLSKREYAESLASEPLDWVTGDMTPEMAKTMRDAAALMAKTTAKINARQIARHLDGPIFLRMLEAYLAAGADPNAPWDNGFTMLMGVGPKTASLLLRNGADLNARNNNGQTALHLVKNPKVVAVLAAHGADLNAVSTPLDMNDQHANFSTPLQSALAAEDYISNGVAIVEALLAAGADPKHKDGVGNTTLAYVRSPKRLEELMAMGLDPLAPQAGHGTVLHAMSGHLAGGHSKKAIWTVVDRLIELGIDVNAQDAHGQTILHEMAKRSWVATESVLAMIDRGADPALRDADGNRAIDLVSERARSDGLVSALNTLSKQ